MLVLRLAVALLVVGCAFSMNPKHYKHTGHDDDHPVWKDRQVKTKRQVENIATKLEQELKDVKAKLNEIDNSVADGSMTEGEGVDARRQAKKPVLKHCDSILHEHFPAEDLRHDRETKDKVDELAIRCEEIEEELVADEVKTRRSKRDWEVDRRSRQDQRLKQRADTLRSRRRNGAY